MRNKEIRKITIGAMLASVFGVLGIINLYTGTNFDILFSYFIAVVIALYCEEYGLQAALLVVLTTVFVLFVVGQLFFMVFTGLTMVLSTILVTIDKNHWIITRAISLVKNFMVFYLLAGLLGIDFVREGKEAVSQVNNLLGTNITVNLILLQIGIIVFISLLETVMLERYIILLKRYMVKRKGIR